MIDALPNAEWRLWFGLACYAGLRSPSETHQLTWADVSFDTNKLTVRSPKTEGHSGKAMRIVPIRAELTTLLHERLETAYEGEEQLLAPRSERLTYNTFRDACARAGVEPWERLWQTQRSSCERDWLNQGLPSYAVARWMGHSERVSQKHYTTGIPDELYARATRGAPLQAPLQIPASKRDGAQLDAEQKPRKGHNTRHCNNLHRRSDSVQDDAKMQPNWRRGESNPRPETGPGKLLRA